MLIFLWLKIDNFNQSSSSEVLLFFSPHNVWDPRNSGWKRNCQVIPEKQFVIDILFHRYLWGEPYLLQIGILKRYNNFKCALRQRCKLFAQSTQTFGNVTVARYEFGIKFCLTLKVNQPIFIKYFDKKCQWPDKFTRSVRSSKTIFKCSRKAFHAMSTKNTKGKMDAPRLFNHYMTQSHSLVTLISYYAIVFSSTLMFTDSWFTWCVIAFCIASVY